MRKQNSLREFLSDLKNFYRENKQTWRTFMSPATKINTEGSIYPISIPEINFSSNQDFILITLPASVAAMMPNGLGYVDNILRALGINHQTIDIDNIMYHRFHSDRISKDLGEIEAPNGFKIKADPWDPAGIDELWNNEEFLEYFSDTFREIADGLIKAAPKILGISLHATNKTITKKIIEMVRKGSPDTIIVIGGYSCVHPKKGTYNFPDFDFMVINEAEETLGPLVKKLLNGERPKDTPGIISKIDTPDIPFTPGPLLQDLDSIEFPKYDWTDFSLYRRYNGKNLTPLVFGRGCLWSRCRFCAERFSWRGRNAKLVVDEIEWLMDKGSKVFQINDSDLNSDPDTNIEICEEIIKRGIKPVLTAQLRVHKKGTLEYYKKMREAGFTRMRFGIDAFTNQTLKIQNKGYTVEMINRTFNYVREAGIYIACNLVIGVPGETEEDIQETLQNIIGVKDCIGIFESIRTLLLVEGSLYYLDPEKYNIHFRGDKEDLYLKHPSIIPDKLWYSENPYIDHEVKKKRWQFLAEGLVAGGVNFGPYVKLRAKNENVDVEGEMISH